MKQFTENDLVYETDNHTVRFVETGLYEVYQENLTHAVRVDTIHYSNDPDLAYRHAIATCETREKDYKEKENEKSLSRHEIKRSK